MPDRATLLSQARRLHQQSRWPEACDAFLAADQRSLLAVEDLELFAESAQILGRRDDAVRALERSFHARAEAGEIKFALRSAFWLWQAWALSSEFARASGWMARARRLTAENAGTTEHGWLLVTDAYGQIAAAAPDAAVAMLVMAAELGARDGDPDLVAFATTMCGRALIKAGKLKEGVSRLDEAMLQVTAGDLSPRARSMLYCSAIATCHETGELARAQEWTLALGSWLDGIPQLGGVYFGNCRIYRSQLMRLRGAWPQAIHELQVACQDLSQGSGRLVVGHAFYQLGEMHRLQGSPEAEAAYRRAGEYGAPTQPGLALLRLQQEEIDTAASAIRRALRETEALLDRFQLLPAFVRIMLAAGDLDAAREGAVELGRVAHVYDTAAVRAEAAHAEGELTLAERRPESALPILRRAARAWRQLNAPYETARVSIAIATACRALSDEEAALLELESARSVFAELGARPDLERVEVMIDPGPAAHAHGLTSRELEVLRLVASGKTNRAIAAELYLSERTVHRHVTNIFGKLGVGSRTAAVAYAIEHHLFQPRIL